MSESPAPPPESRETAGGPLRSGGHAELRTVQMVSGMVGMGALMLSAVRVIVDPAAPVPSVLAIAIVVVALLGSALLIRRVGYAVPALPQGLPRENAEAMSLRFFTSTTILRTALAETPVLVAFAVSFAFTPHSWLTLLIALPGGLALFWLHAWPSPRTAAALAEALEADGAESHLGEVLGLR
ncbi:MAG: hypothetical protein JWP82_3359 [Humibacillus sp.]|nr:hypothetical protein [Humibacillus sp.]